MTPKKQWNILFIQQENSLLDMSTPLFTSLFKSVDKVKGTSSVLHLFQRKQYDIIIGDLTVKPEELALLKQLQDAKKEQTIFALVSPKDTDKLFAISQIGIHAVELEAQQFEQALEMIADFNPYPKK